MENHAKSREDLLEEIRDLRTRLDEAEVALRAISKNRNNDARKHKENETRWAKERNSALASADKVLLAERIERQNIEQRLGQTQEQLQNVSFRLLKAEERERKRIAQEIHDGIAQYWSTVKFQIENILTQLDEKIATPLKDILPIIHVGLEETRRIQMNLRPPLLDDLGILATITWLCREFQKAHPDINVETKINIQESEVPSDAKTVIYRILQEALNNVVKHSKGTLVKFSIGKKQDTIEIILQDNGQGFDLNEVLALKSYESGLGIAGMKERTHLSGGTLSIESAKGAGTVIRASWSISNESLA